MARFHKVVPITQLLTDKLRAKEGAVLAEVSSIIRDNNLLLVGMVAEVGVPDERLSMIAQTPDLEGLNGQKYEKKLLLRIDWAIDAMESVARTLRRNIRKRGSKK